MIDCFEFLTTRKCDLGRANRAIAAELVDEHADRAWDELDMELDDDVGDGLSVIDADEFELRYVLEEGSEPDDAATPVDGFAPEQRLRLEMEDPLLHSRIETLKKIGYIVEDMGHNYGDWFAGQYRWMSPTYFQDHEPCGTPADAWRLAWSAFMHS